MKNFRFDTIRNINQEPLELQRFNCACGGGGGGEGGHQQVCCNKISSLAVINWKIVAYATVCSKSCITHKLNIKSYKLTCFVYILSNVIKYIIMKWTFNKHIGKTFKVWNHYDTFAAAENRQLASILSGITTWLTFLILSNSSSARLTDLSFSCSITFAQKGQWQKYAWL